MGTTSAGMADSEAPHQQAQLIVSHHTSRYGRYRSTTPLGLSGKRSAGMLIEYQLSNKRQSCSSTQPVGMFEQQHCLWHLHLTSRYICCSCSDILVALYTEWNKNSEHLCYIGNVTTDMCDGASQC